MSCHYVIMSSGLSGRDENVLCWATTRVAATRGTHLKQSLITRSDCADSLGGCQQCTKRSQIVAWRTPMTLLASCLLFALLFFTFPVHALASTGMMDAERACARCAGGTSARSLRSAFQNLARTSRPTMQVNAGFETRYQDGNWVPVQVALHNDGPDFSGTLSINASTDNGAFIGSGIVSTPSHYQVPITLANGAQKQVTIYVPIYFDVQNVVVRLLDSS